MTELEKIIQAIRKLNSEFNPDQALAQVELFEEAVKNRSRPGTVVGKDDDREQLYARLRQEAEVDEKAFVTLVSSISPDSNDCLFEMYEALTPNAGRWREFYLSELERLLGSTELSDREYRGGIRHVLLGMALAMEADSELWSRIRERLSELMKAPDPLGLFGLLLLGELSPTGDPELVHLFCEEMKSRRWQRRYLARYFYNDQKGRPLKDRMGLLDGLRALFCDPLRS